MHVGCWPVAGREGRKRVSRRVGGLVPERANGRGQGGAPYALNDLDPCPWSATPSALAWPSRGAGVWLVEVLGRCR